MQLKGTTGEIQNVVPSATQCDEIGCSDRTCENNKLKYLMPYLESLRKGV